MRQKYFSSAVIIVFSLSFLAGCSPHAEFDHQIKASKSLGLDVIPIVKSGVPYFEKKKLIPTWKTDEKLSLASLRNIQLTDHNGNKIGDSFFKGQPTFVVFFFSSCGVFCPTLIKKFKTLSSELSDFKTNRYLAISVDPDRDTTERLAEYKTQIVGENTQNWYFASTAKKHLDYLANEIFSIEIYNDPESGRIIHSERVFLIDENGFMRGVFRGTRVELAKKTRATLNRLRQ